MTLTRTRLLPASYGRLFAEAGFRRLMPAIFASDLGDGMSVVTVAWLAILIASPGHAGPLVGAAVAAYTLPGAPAPCCSAGGGGVIYGPFTALTYTLFQDRTPAAWLTSVLAFRSAALLTASPVGTALGGPLTAALGPRWVLAGSGAATVVLAAAATGLLLWRRATGRGRSA